VSLAGIEAIHLNWHSGVNLSAYTSAEQTMTAQQLVPQSITAFMLGLESKLATFKV
jgi:putative ABC transport system permease protein